MKDELVRKQDVIDAIHKEWDEVLVFNESGSTIAGCCEYVIDTLPAIKISTGENKANVIIEKYKNKSLIDLGVVFGGERFFCDNCKNEIDISYDYCPKCGCKLIWESKKE